MQAASLRQQVLAHNIANANTPGFKRSRVEFENRLNEAVAAGQDPAAVRAQVVKEVDLAGRPDGNNVDIEREMTSLAQNQIWYATLTRQLSDQLARIRMVINDGRR